MNKIHVLIIVRNHSDFSRLHPIITELSWTSRVVDLSQLSAALVTRRFDWVIAIDLPQDCEDLSSFLNHLESFSETKSFNFISLNHDMIDVSYEKLKLIMTELYQQLFLISCGNGKNSFLLSETLIANIRFGHSRFQTREQAQYMALFLSQLTAESESTYLGLRDLFIKAIEHGNVAAAQNDNSEHSDEMNFQCLDGDENHNIYTYVYYFIREDLVSFDIKNNGIGFDCQPFLAVNSDRILDKNSHHSASF